MLAARERGRPFIGGTTWSRPPTHHPRGQILPPQPFSRGVLATPRPILPVAISPPCSAEVNSAPLVFGRSRARPSIFVGAELVPPPDPPPAGSNPAPSTNDSSRGAAAPRSISRRLYPPCPPRSAEVNSASLVLGGPCGPPFLFPAAFGPRASARLGSAIRFAFHRNRTGAVTATMLRCAGGRQEGQG